MEKIQQKSEEISEKDRNKSRTHNGREKYEKRQKSSEYRSRSWSDSRDMLLVLEICY